MTGFDGPVFVHSDVGRGLIALKRKGIRIKPNDICTSILDFLSSLSGDGRRGIILPAFNYDFGETLTFKPNHDPIQVGAFPEWARTNCDFVRSFIPFFSTLSVQSNQPYNHQLINPFGPQSVFSQLIRDDGIIVLLGVDISSMTFIHHVEEIAGKPCYRYDKSFRGTIFLDDDSSYVCELCMHVRPLGAGLDYDWRRLQQELIGEGILETDDEAPDLKYVRAQKLAEYWGDRITSDPLYLLDPQSRRNFIGPTSNGRKRVSIEEYELTE